MLIFGWICLLIITLLFSIYLIGMIVLSISFSGTIILDIGQIILYLIGIILWYVVIVNCPFVIGIL